MVTAADIDRLLPGPTAPAALPPRPAGQTFETFKQEAEKDFCSEAAGARLERVRDRAGAEDAAVQPVQEDRALRPDPGVGMTEQPRDWDRELADIDQAIAKQAAPHRPRGAGAGRPRARPDHAAPPRFVALTWFWTGLAICLGVALVLWPYDKTAACGSIFFLGAGVVTALLAGCRRARRWPHRRGWRTSCRCS